MPDWYSSWKPEPNNKNDWYRRFSVKKAFRTAGLVRGAHPYSLIVDDLQVDAAPHHYDWGMVLDDDRALGSSRLIAADRQRLAGLKPSSTRTPSPIPKLATPPETDRHLLVLVFSDGPLTDKSIAVNILKFPNPPQRDMEIDKFHLASDGVSSGVQGLLLFPFKDGQPLPETKLSADRRTLTVAWPDQIDTVTFTTGEGGRTGVSISRGNQEIANTGS